MAYWHFRHALLQRFSDLPVPAYGKVFPTSCLRRFSVTFIFGLLLSVLTRARVLGSVRKVFPPERDSSGGESVDRAYTRVDSRRRGGGMDVGGKACSARRYGRCLLSISLFGVIYIYSITNWFA